MNFDMKDRFPCDDVQKTNISIKINISTDREKPHYIYARQDHWNRQTEEIRQFTNSEEYKAREREIWFGKIK
jgi:hypothetical protein